MPRFHIPLSVVMVLQCLLVATAISIIIAVMSTQMRSNTEDQVQQRLTARLSTVRESILKPFAAGQLLGDNLAAMFKDDPAKYRTNGASNKLAPDTTYLRVAGSFVQSSEYVQFVSQTSSDQMVNLVANNDANGWANYTITNDTASTMTVNIAFKTAAMKINKGSISAGALPIGYPDAAYQFFPQQDVGPYTFDRDHLLESALKDESGATRAWLTRPVSLEGDGAVKVSDLPYSLLGTYTISLERRDDVLANLATAYAPPSVPPSTYHFPNTWLVFVCVDLLTVPPILQTLVDGGDSYGLLYDLSLPDESQHGLVATSDTTFNVIDNSTNAGYLKFYQPHLSPNADFNKWFAQARERSIAIQPQSFINASTATGLQDAYRVDGRFISFAHIVLESDTDVSSSNSLHLLAIVSTGEYRYFGAQTRLTNTMIGIGVASGVVLVLVCLAIMLLIWFPIQDIRANMALASVLQNESVKPTASFLTEIDTLCQSFAKMNEILLDARAFMPASMLARLQESDFDDVDGEEEDDQTGVNSVRRRGDDGHETSATETTDGTVYSQCTMKSNSPHLKQPRSPKFSDNRSVRSVFDVGSTAQQSRSTDPSKGVTNLSALKSKRIAVLCVNVRGFMKAGVTVNTIQGHALAIVNIVALAVSRERGVIDSFHGDHFVITFNAVKTAASPGKKAALCSIAIANATSNTPYAALSMGASSGNAIVGPLGNATLRRLSVVGNCYTKALTLQRVSAQLERSVESSLTAAESSRLENSVAGSTKSQPAMKRNSPNCFYCLIDHPTMSEARGAIEALLIGAAVATTVKLARRNPTTHRMSSTQLQQLGQPPIHAETSEAKGLGRVRSVVLMGQAEECNDPLAIQPQQQQPQQQFVYAAIPKDNANGKATQGTGLAPEVDDDDRDEWMYDLQKQIETDNFRFINKATEALLTITKNSASEKLVEVVYSAEERLRSLIDECSGSRSTSISKHPEAAPLHPPVSVGTDFFAMRAAAQSAEHANGESSFEKALRLVIASLLSSGERLTNAQASSQLDSCSLAELFSTFESDRQRDVSELAAWIRVASLVDQYGPSQFPLVSLTCDTVGNFPQIAK